jgi:hypothetical protein
MFGNSYLSNYSEIAARRVMLTSYAIFSESSEILEKDNILDYGEIMLKTVKSIALVNVKKHRGLIGPMKKKLLKLMININIY